ncbi:Plancitoxin-1 [Trichinella britovi]|uniref:Plancitoxin-1 n=1 Tax=Trichinella britovi TaxID=45882 RepID=A0A0V1C9V6_TRIBR|nr:Plancitoxin-1 [Trichinella britovi]
MKFTAVVCILILLKTSTAQPPDSLDSKIIKSGPNPVWERSARAINEIADHAISKTMASFIVEHRNIKVLAYSDDPPNMPPQNVNSKAKGVLLIDNRETDAAAWFVHTVPKFLAYRGPYSWPASETAKGHMFLCVSFTEAHLNSVAKAIRYQEPFIYANNLSPELLTQHNELSNLATGVQIRVPPFLEHAKFTTKANPVAANIQVIGKHSKSYSDMYAKVLKNKLGASIIIWASSDTRSKSICKGQYQLRKVTSPLQLADSQVRRVVLVDNGADAAAWFVHTASNFLAHLGGYLWPQSETTKGHMFLCLSLDKANLNLVGKAVRYQEPCIYANNLPPAILNQYIELSNLVNGVDVRITPFLEHAKFTTKAAHAVANIQAFGKHSKSFADMYARVLRNKFAASIRVWAPSDTRSKSICNRQYQLRKIVSPMQFAGSQVSCEADSARWPLVEGKNTICFTTNDYKISEKQIPGAAICLENAGVLLVDSTGTDAAAWFVHTVPNFLAHLGGYSWPASETAKGHMFLCLSLNEAQLNSVAKAIRYQEPFIYANNLSPELLIQYNELSNLATGVEIRVTPFLEHAKFTTKSANGAAANIEAFGKHKKSYLDMYAKVLKNKLGASIRIWASSDTRSKSICKGQYQLRKVASPMQFDGVQVRREDDSAKWALIEGKNTVCFTTNDYKMNEKRIPGAAVCLENAGVYTAFTAAAFNVEGCNKYFVYKPPNVLSSKLLKSGGNPAWAPSMQNINQGADHSIVRTMESYVQHRAEIKVLAYSDDPPNLPPRNEKSKTKGVLLVHNAADEAAWFVHTVPNFLAYLSAYSWPQAETAKGHMFLCVSFSKVHLNFVGVLLVHNAADEAAWFVHTVPNFLAYLSAYSWPQAETAKGHMFLCVSFSQPPNVLSSKLLKSGGNPVWADSRTNIDQNRDHSIITTMANFVQYHAQINVLAYSDDPPNLPPRNEKSKTKGILLVRSGADEAAWFVHTVPNFLAYLSAYSWPPAETAKGHMFLCISFSSALLNSVGKAIRYQEPYVYVNNLPAAILNQNMELFNLINGIDVRVTPFLAHERFATKSVQAVANIQAFGKHSKSFADMYARILRNRFAASIMVWSPADARSKSICRGQHKLQKITSIQFDGVQVSRGADSAKWALIDGKNIATDKRTPGAAVCLENAGVYNAFRTAAFNPPNAVSSSIIKSDANFVWAPSAQNVNLDREHSIVRTMADFIANNGDIKVLAYSDDPPNLPSRNEKSKAKGVLLVHSGADDEAAWFVHTVPKFLAHLGVYSWPAAETPKGHMFLCLSLSKAHLNSVAKAIRYQEPFIYANNLSPALLTQYNELSNLATGVEIRVTPFLEHAKFTTKAVQVAANIEAFGKHTKSYSGKAIRYQEPYIYASNLPPAILNQYIELSNLVNGVDVRITPFLEHAKFTTKAAHAVANIQAFGKHTKSYSDMYARVLKNKFAASIRIWASSDTRSKSICKGQYKLRKIASPMQFAGSQVSREADSARWAVVDGKNTVCLTTNDYQVGEKKIPGAAVCLENAGLYNAFSAAALLKSPFD